MHAFHHLFLLASEIVEDAEKALHLFETLTHFAHLATHFTH